MEFIFYSNGVDILKYNVGCKWHRHGVMRYILIAVRVNVKHLLERLVVHRGG